MKIAVWHNLPSGGGKRALYDHVRGLIGRGHTVEAWCLSTADRDYLPLKDLVTEHVIDFEWKASSFPGLSRLSFAQYFNTTSRLKAFAKASQRCGEEIRAGAFDLLFANSSILYYMPFIGRYLDIPKVLYLQEPYRPLYEANPSLPWVAKSYDDVPKPLRLLKLINGLPPLQALRIQAREEWINAKFFNRILVNSYYSRESTLRAYGCDATVCYPGIDTSHFRHLNQPRENFIVGVGSFSALKGVDLAIKAVSLLGRSKPPLIWIANAADISYVNEMTSLAADLGVTLQIKSLVSDDEVISILNRATLLLYTSRLEPLGYAPLEANACATPVVAVAEGGVRETVRDGVNGLLSSRDPQCLADAMEKLLSDPVLARKLGENGLHLVEHEWNLARGIERLEEQLLEIAGSKMQAQLG
jgi:glycosyltransferase involved in cell wall biosynthesis